MSKFELYEDVNSQYRFRLIAPNGEIIAVSEGYASKQNAKNGIRAVKRYAIEAKLFEVRDGNELVEFIMS